MKRSSEPSSARWIDARRVLGVVGAHVGEPEPRAASGSRAGSSPSASERPSDVGHVQVDLRPVEGALALVDRVLDPVPLERRLERALGVVPLLVGAEPVLGPRRELGARRRAEERRRGTTRSRGSRRSRPAICSSVQKMCASSWVTCRTRSRPCSVAGELVAVQRRRLGVADRQVAVAAQRASRRGACGPGSSSASAPSVRSSLVAATKNMFSRNFSQWPEVIVGLDVVEQRRLHLDVAALQVLAPAQVLERVPDHHPLRVPERRARASARRGGRGRAARPSRRWSRALASSSRSRCASRSACE